jgi:hypothetical protein
MHPTILAKHTGRGIGNSLTLPSGNCLALRFLPSKLGRLPPFRPVISTFPGLAANHRSMGASTLWLTCFGHIDQCIKRHKTAIRRKDFSLSVKCLLRDGLLVTGRTFFDYGCGHGEDVELLGPRGGG